MEFETVLLMMPEVFRAAEGRRDADGNDARGIVSECFRRKKGRRRHKIKGNPLFWIAFDFFDGPKSIYRSQNDRLR